MAPATQVSPGRSIRVPAAEHRHTAAYWYAAGMADGTGEPDRSWSFARFHKAQALAYYRDQSRTFLSSVPDAWREFVAGEQDR